MTPQKLLRKKAVCNLTCEPHISLSEPHKLPSIVNERIQILHEDRIPTVCVGATADFSVSLREHEE